VLDARVVLEPVDRQVLAVARVLEPAVRHLRHEGNVGVDPHRTEIEAPRHSHGPTMVAGPHAGRKAVLDTIRPAYGVFIIVKSLDSDHWAEDLVLHHLVVLPEASDDRRLVEVADAADARAAGDDRRVGRRTGQKPLYASQLSRVVDRTERRVGHRKVADLRSL